METKEISKSQFKAKALEFFRQIEASGESLIVTDFGKPTIEVRPFRFAAQQPLDILKNTVLQYDHPTEPIETTWDVME